MMKNSSLLFILFILLGIGCHRIETIDGSSKESYWKTVGALNKTLPRDELVQFQFALTKLRKRGYTEDELANLPEPPLDLTFLKTVHGKSVSDILQIAGHIPDKTIELNTEREAISGKM